MNAPLIIGHIFYEPPSTAQSRSDKVLGTVLILCVLFGTAANVQSLRYFLSTKKRNLSTLLYQTICCLDLCTCSLPSLPVAVSLFLNRRPVLFNSSALCLIWWLLFRVLHLGSMFLVMLLSVSRTLSMKLPFFRLSKRWVFSTFLGFVSILFLYCLTVSTFISSDVDVKYTSADVHCFLNTQTWPITDSTVLKVDTITVGLITGIIPVAWSWEPPSLSAVMRLRRKQPL